MSAWPGDGDQSAFPQGMPPICNWGLLQKAFKLSQMNLGLLFLESISSGVITKEEMNWVTHHQRNFSRIEEATAIKLGRMVDRGSIQLGCRI